MKAIKQLGGAYTASNKDTAYRFCRLITLFEHNSLHNEATVLRNLYVSRSNYLHARSEKSRGGNSRIGGYTRSFRKAKSDALKLYRELSENPPKDILLSSYSIVVEYIREECSSIT